MTYPPKASCNISIAADLGQLLTKSCLRVLAVWCCSKLATQSDLLQGVRGIQLSNGLQSMRLNTQHISLCLVQGAHEEAAPIQCNMTGTGEASVSGFEGHTPLSTCICISKHTARQAKLSASDLLLVGKSDPR